MVGSDNRIYHYAYFDSNQDVFQGISIFEFQPNSLDLKDWVYANRAEWNRTNWIFHDGWMRKIRPDGIDYQPFTEMPVAGVDTPDYFKKEVRTAEKMTYVELRQYVDEMRRSGFNVSSLTVDLHRKLSFPLVSFIMAVIGIPFSFTTGKRGAFYGIGLCVGLGIFYWATFELFTKLGGISELSPLIAAWFPNLIFGFGGIWMMLRLKT
jgi:lipopolysaccharide export LptBFGC system permease protein LptF